MEGARDTSRSRNLLRSDYICSKCRLPSICLQRSGLCPTTFDIERPQCIFSTTSRKICNCSCPAQDVGTIFSVPKDMKCYVACCESATFGAHYNISILPVRYLSARYQTCPVCNGRCGLVHTQARLGDVSAACGDSHHSTFQPPS